MQPATLCSFAHAPKCDLTKPLNVSFEFSVAVDASSTFGGFDHLESRFVGEGFCIGRNFSLTFRVVNRRRTGRRCVLGTINVTACSIGIIELQDTCLRKHTRRSIWKTDAGRCLQSLLADHQRSSPGCPLQLRLIRIESRNTRQLREEILPRVRIEAVRIVRASGGSQSCLLRPAPTMPPSDE